MTGHCDATTYADYFYFFIYDIESFAFEQRKCKHGREQKVLCVRQGKPGSTVVVP